MAVLCREGVCCPALVGTLCRDERWNQCCAGRVQLRGRLVPLSGYQVRSGEVQGSSAEPGAFWVSQGLTGAFRFRGWGLPSLTAQFAQLRCAAALGVPVVLDATCENAVAAIRRPTGV